MISKNTRIYKGGKIMEEEVKKENKKRLTPETTILMALGGVALAVVVYGIVHFIITTF